MIDKLLQDGIGWTSCRLYHNIFVETNVIRGVPDNIDASLEFMKVCSLELGFICWLRQCSAQIISLGTFQDRFLNSGRVEHINSLISSLCLSFDKPIPFLHLLLPIPSYPPHYKYQNIRRIAGQTGYQDRHDIRIAGTVQLKSLPVLFFFMWGQEGGGGGKGP